MIKKLYLKLPVFIVTSFKLFLLEFSILNLCRLIFYFGFKTVDESEINFSTIAWAFRMGLEFDMVATTYALLLPILLLLLNDLFVKKTLAFYQLARYSTFIIFCLYALVSSADFPYYQQFGTHLNKQAFLWAASPWFVFKLIAGNVSYYGYFFLFVVFAYSIYRIVNRIFLNSSSMYSSHTKSIKGILLSTILLIPLLIVGARGRLSSKSTTHEGMAIVSDNLFVNQIALNPNFTLFRSLLFQKIKKYQIPNNIDSSIAFARNYFGIDGAFEKSITRKVKNDSAFKPYNVVIVCMESMSAYKTGIHGKENLTPYFNNIIKESLYFDRFFSSGIHTFNGLFSTCAAYPSMLTDHCLRRYTRRPFTTLGNLLLQKNYETFFYSTHDPHFDNMEGFFKQNGFKQVYSAFDLPKEKTISVTGVADHEIFNLFINKTNNMIDSKPFLAFIMTGSDHGPWVIPKDIPFKPSANTEEKRSTQYADWAIGYLMELAKKQKWFDNTLFVFLGDHGYSIGGCYEMPLSYHHIPFVLYKPNSLKPDTNHHLGFQPDVLSTVAGLMNLNFENNSFGSNIIKEKHPFVYFTADDKIGCVSDDGFFFYELMSQKTKRLSKFWDLDQKDYYLENKAKADSLKIGAMHLLDAAEFFIRRDYFSY